MLCWTRWVTLDTRSMTLLRETTCTAFAAPKSGEGLETGTTMLVKPQARTGSKRRAMYSRALKILERMVPTGQPMSLAMASYR